MKNEVGTVEGQDWILADGHQYREIVRMPSTDDDSVSILLSRVEGSATSIRRPWWRFW